jgi:hypothetical protein
MFPHYCKWVMLNGLKFPVMRLLRQRRCQKHLDCVCAVALSPPGLLGLGIPTIEYLNINFASYQLCVGVRKLLT